MPHGLPALQATYRLGADIHVEPSRNSVRRAGEEVFLRPKTFQVLLHLLERPGQLVTNDELVQAVWSDPIVSDDVIAESIVSIRKLLGDDPRLPRFVRTLGRAGYMFIGPVDVIVQPAPVPTPQPVEAMSVSDEPVSPTNEVHLWLGRRAWWLTLAGAVVMATLA
jgi:DNA-binding winged helix-turn-helix (wHTH) protein